MGGQYRHYYQQQHDHRPGTQSDVYDARAATGVPAGGRRDSGESANSGGSSRANPSDGGSRLPANGRGDDVALRGFSKEQDARRVAAATEVALLRRAVTDLLRLDSSHSPHRGRRYQLVVVQSPSRARMCGFGDKDRRPLSPTLIVRLIVTDVETNRLIPPTEVDTSGFFLAADLVHPEDLKSVPRNLLLHQHAATVSTVIAHPDYSNSGLPAHHHHPSAPPPTFDVDRVRSRSLSDPWRGAQVTPSSWSNDPDPNSLPPPPCHFSTTTITTETYTRNFVGASVASANLLKDESEEVGIFFVLQDLSVRTEGVYRIKLMFANLSTAGETTSAPAVGSAEENGEQRGADERDGIKDERDGDLSTATQQEDQEAQQPTAASSNSNGKGISGALAGTYTDAFTVYTPRRFPGVIEPTALSRKFAAQGVKIPVRVDRKKKRRGTGGRGGGVGGEEDEFEEDEYADEY